MLLVNMYVINYCLFLNYLILFLQRYKKDKSVIGIKIKILILAYMSLLILCTILYLYPKHI